jgi:hypothetical protein
VGDRAATHQIPHRRDSLVRHGQITIVRESARTKKVNRFLKENFKKKGRTLSTDTQYNNSENIGESSQ